jgi:hypothetical protein
MKVAVIEGHDIGGTCVNRGCVPSKALLAAAGRIREMKNEQHMKSMGIQVRVCACVCVGGGVRGGGHMSCNQGIRVAGWEGWGWGEVRGGARSIHGRDQLGEK